MPNFIQLIEPTIIHYRIKLHLNPDSSYLVKGIFYQKKGKQLSKSKIRVDVIK